MKKVLSIILTMIITAILLSVATAENGKIIEPMPSLLKANELKNQMFAADIVYLGDDCLDLTLYEQVIFTEESISKIKAGDTIIINNMSYEIEDWTWEDQEILVINKNAENEEIKFIVNQKGEYIPLNEFNEPIYRKVSKLTTEINDYVIVVDTMNEDNEYDTKNPIVRSVSELREMLQKSPEEFTHNSICALFDANNDLYMIIRDDLIAR